MILIATTVWPHSASDAYLTLEAAGRDAAGNAVIRGQWDIALRDLDFVLGLDTDGNGAITWRELRPRQADIERYAYTALHAATGTNACALQATGQKVDQHADGSYAALSFTWICPQADRRLILDYRLFFAIDPSHRCILVFRNGGETATALLAPDQARLELPLNRKARKDRIK